LLLHCRRQAESEDKLVAGRLLELRAEFKVSDKMATSNAAPSPICDLATAGKIDPASRVAIARAGSGVSVAAGSPKPDVSTAETLKRTLLQAKSIGFTGIGSSRPGNEALLAKLGIADHNGKTIPIITATAR
jgi:hypothetical protein